MIGYGFAMKHVALVSLIASLSAVVVACGATQTDPVSPPEPAEVTWPEEMVTNAGEGPALFIGPSASDAAIGYISSGVSVRITGPGTADRVPVRISGALKVRGWLRSARLGLRAQQRGRIQGSAGYVGPNDIVTVLGESSQPGMMRVSVSPHLLDGTALGPFVGEFPSSSLAVTAAPEDAQAPSSGAFHVLPADREVEVFDRRAGSVIATLPARPDAAVVQVVRQRDEWSAVRIGTGPYISGWINIPTVATVASGEAAPPPQGEIPARVQRDVRDRQLWRLPAQARVRFPTAENPTFTFGILAGNGFAIEIARHESDGRIDAFVAVNDDLAIRGLVDIDQLQPLDD